MNILIIGIHGFVGSNMISALKRDNIIYGLDIVFPNKEGVLKTYSWDDLDNDRLPDVDVIIHLAGIAHDTRNEKASEDYFKINTDLTKKSYDYFLQHKLIKKFIFFSSVKAAVDRVEGNYLTEDVTPCPAGPYGMSKLRAEEYILGNLYKTEGRQTVILRPCMIHGPGNKGNLNLLYEFVKKGFPWPLGAFDNRRTFTSITNLNFVITGLLEQSVESGIYNMADDEGLSTNELIEIMCEVIGKKKYVWKINKKLILTVSKIGDLFNLPLNSYRLNKLTEDFMVSNEKIKKALGIEKMPEDARAGIKSTIESFVNNAEICSIY